MDGGREGGRDGGRDGGRKVCREEEGGSSGMVRGRDSTDA